MGAGFADGGPLVGLSILDVEEKQAILFEIFAISVDFTVSCSW